MPQTASLTGDTERPKPGYHVRPAPHTAAQPTIPGVASIRESQPTTVIRAPSFSLLALARGVVRLVHYRDLLYTLSVHRLKVRYKQSVLGPSWAVLQPLSLMLIYTVIFSRIARVPSEGAPYALFAYCALLPWTYFSTALSTATVSLVSHFSLVTKVYFPREILPLTYVIASLVDFLVASTVLGGMLLYYDVSLTAQASMRFRRLRSSRCSRSLSHSCCAPYKCATGTLVWRCRSCCSCGCSPRRSFTHSALSRSHGGRSTCSIRWSASSKASGGSSCKVSRQISTLWRYRRSSR